MRCACDNVSQGAKTTAASTVPHPAAPPRAAHALAPCDSERAAWDECVHMVRGALDDAAAINAANKRLRDESRDLRAQLAAALTHNDALSNALVEARDATNAAAATIKRLQRQCATYEAQLGALQGGKV
jgi:septal ring factor EnvC (AmiA/AmiB activator)